MNKLSSSYQYNKAKSRFFGLLLVLSTIGAILIFHLNSAEKQAIDEQIAFLKLNKTISDRDEQAYKAGFEKGWRDALSFLKLHADLKIEMTK